MPDGPPGGAGGILAGYYVKSATTGGFAKPSKPPDPRLGRNHTENLPAAHEKIAADLAYLLRLPVPPAILWDRGPQPVLERQHCVISAVPFAPVFTWDQITRVPGAARIVVPALSRAASAMVAFDTWLDNRDRVNGGNLIVSQDAATGEVRFAYIDFAQSMSFAWLDGPPLSILTVAERFPTAPALDVNAIHEGVVAIEALPQAQLETVVKRIPEGFISQQRRACITSGLLQRRSELRAALRQKYGAPL